MAFANRSLTEDGQGLPCWRGLLSFRRVFGRVGKPLLRRDDSRRGQVETKLFLAKALGALGKLPIDQGLIEGACGHSVKGITGQGKIEMGNRFGKVAIPRQGA